LPDRKNGPGNWRFEAGDLDPGCAGGPQTSLRSYHQRTRVNLTTFLDKFLRKQNKNISQEERAWDSSQTPVRPANPPREHTKICQQTYWERPLGSARHLRGYFERNMGVLGIAREATPAENGWEEKDGDRTNSFGGPTILSTQVQQKETSRKRVLVGEPTGNDFSR